VVFDVVENAPQLFPMPRAYPLDPPPALVEMQAEGPIGRIRLYRGDEAWVILSYAECMRLLRLPGFSADFERPGYPIVNPTLTHFASGLLHHMDPPKHDVYRRMLAPEFAPKHIDRLRDWVTKLVHGLFDEMMAAGPGVDMVDALAIAVPAHVTCELLGVPYEHREFFVQCTEAFLGGTASPKEVERAQNELTTLLRTIIRSVRTDPGDDLLSRVVGDYVDTGQLEEEMLVSFALLLLVAGFDTTSNMISVGTVALLENPEQFAALRSDPSLVVAGVEELNRYLTVSHLGRHRAATDYIEVGGQLIQPGDGVIMALNIANRDPDQFENPNTLDLAMGKRPNLTFGMGIHQCLGATLARLELQVVFTALVERMPNLQMSMPLEDLPFKTKSAVYGLQALPISW
jgi:cytochrome P450